MIPMKETLLVIHHWHGLLGHEGVVKLLLEREEVNPDRPDRRSPSKHGPSKDGRTALSYAASGEYESGETITRTGRCQS